MSLPAPLKIALGATQHLIWYVSYHAEPSGILRPVR
jgi:hypothetical protein